MSEEYKTVTIEEIKREWGRFAIDYLHEIITGEYKLDDAREDILSFRKNKEPK